jgi:hypothetical protein
MKQKIFTTAAKIFFISTMIFIMPLVQANAAAGKTVLNVVGLYSETDAGSVSYRVGTQPWKVIKVGDKIPDNAEITITVEMDWVELSPSTNPNTVYSITGDVKPVIKKMADLLKEKPKTVNIPASGKADPKFANKLVVKQYLGRQVAKKNSNVDWDDLKYGDVLESTGEVKIIAINNTLNLILPNGKEIQIIGPIKFKVSQVLKGENIYKYLNVTK